MQRKEIHLIQPTCDILKSRKYHWWFWRTDFSNTVNGSDPKLRNKKNPAL